MGERPAFYALQPGGWRDYVTLLHPPYTAWHLSYVAIGAAAAPRLNGGRLGASAAAFFFAVGLAAHALDELNGRPLRTRISDRALRVIAGSSLVLAVSLGVAGALSVTLWLFAFVGFGVFIVLAYNLEMFGGVFHSDLWFAVSWGAFPALTGYFAQAETIRWPVLFVAFACLLLSLAQRRLSTPVRRLRRSVTSLEGRMRLADGTEVAVTDSMLREAPEAALRVLALALSALAGGLVAARLS
ncbi:MAG TPA: hypothetical protein VKI20_08250 [Acidimicrobiales bacterium]|nr:hypothetical protein [Acidimicrobiales bacterium]